VALCGLIFCVAGSDALAAEDELAPTPLIKTAIFTRIYGKPTIPHIMKFASDPADATAGTVTGPNAPGAQLNSGLLMFEGLKKSSMPIMGPAGKVRMRGAVAQPASRAAAAKKFSPGLAPYHPASIGRSPGAAPAATGPTARGASLTHSKVPAKTVSFSGRHAVYYAAPLAAAYGGNPSWAWWNGYPYAVAYYNNYPYYGYYPAGPYVVPYTFAARPVGYGPSFYGPITYPGFYTSFSYPGAYWGYGFPYYGLGYYGPVYYRTYVY